MRRRCRSAGSWGRRSTPRSHTWRLDLEISRRFEFSDYSRTLGFANAVAWIAISEEHHPVLTVSYGSCNVTYTTHAVNGLTDNDFICAAKVDRLLSDWQ